MKVTLACQRKPKASATAYHSYDVRISTLNDTHIILSSPEYDGKMFRPSVQIPLKHVHGFYSDTDGYCITDFANTGRFVIYFANRACAEEHWEKCDEIFPSLGVSGV